MRALEIYKDVRDPVFRLASHEVSSSFCAPPRRGFAARAIDAFAGRWASCTRSATVLLGSRDPARAERRVQRDSGLLRAQRDAFVGIGTFCARFSTLGGGLAVVWFKKSMGRGRFPWRCARRGSGSRRNRRFAGAEAEDSRESVGWRAQEEWRRGNASLCARRRSGAPGFLDVFAAEGRGRPARIIRP